MQTSDIDRAKFLSHKRLYNSRFVERTPAGHVVDDLGAWHAVYGADLLEEMSANKNKVIVAWTRGKRPNEGDLAQIYIVDELEKLPPEEIARLAEDLKADQIRRVRDVLTSNYHEKVPIVGPLPEGFAYPEEAAVDDALKLQMTEAAAKKNTVTPPVEGLIAAVSVIAPPMATAIRLVLDEAEKEVNASDAKLPTVTALLALVRSVVGK